MKKIILLSLLAALILIPSSAFAVGTVSIYSHKVANGFGWVDVRVDTVDGNATALIAPVFQLQNPKWILTGYDTAATPYQYLAIGTQFSSTTTDTVHIGIETSADNASWYAFSTATVQATVHTEGTPRVQYLLLPSARYVRLKFFAKTTDVLGGKLLFSYPVQ